MAEDIYTVTLPDIGEGVVEGEVIEWIKKEGDPVQKDEAVVVVMTDKATVELPAPYPGIIAKHYFQVGQIAIKDRPLYDIRLQEGTKAIPPKKHGTYEKTSKQATTLPKTKTPHASTHTCQGEILAIPKVRHLAKELGIDLSTIRGTGKHGQILLEDLQVPIKPSPTIAPNRFPTDQEQPLTGIRGLMARRMDSTHIPQFSYFEQAETTRLIQLRANLKKRAMEEGINISYMPFLIRALALVAKKHPFLNCSVDMGAGKIILHEEINIGIAMASEMGLIVPVMKGVQKLGLHQTVRAFEELKIKAQTGKLSSNDMKEATITISNFGAVGEGVWATPMISPPEVSILAVARIQKTPVVRENELVIRDMLPLSWSFDHRVIDGELAAKISHDYVHFLQNPASLL